MADNTTLGIMSGGDVIATDDVTDAGVANGAKVQRVKAGFGSNNNYADPTGNTGTVDAGTARVTLATDVALPTGTNVIGKTDGIDAENAAVTANPTLIGGRYDATPRVLGDGDAGAVALDADGAVHVSDGGNSLTIDNADLATLAGAVSGTEMQVDVLTSALPTGAATSANQSTANTSLSNIETAVQLIDDPVATDDTTTHAASTTKVMGIGAVATPTDTNLDANDIGMPAMSVDRRLHTDTQIVGQDAALDVSGATVTVDLSTNNDVQGAVAEGAAVSGNPFLIAGDDGTNVKHVAVAADGAIHIDDGGNSITVDSADLTTLAGAVSGTEMQVDVLTSALPTGAATSANQSTANTSLSNIEAAIATEGSPLGSGILLQGDDGTDRKNLSVDPTTGDLNVNVTNSEDVFAFQTTSTLLNGNSYDSGILTLSPDYSQVQTHVLASHNGEITITWYSDAGGTDLVRTLVIPYTASRGFEMFSAPAFTPYNKYVFLNNSGSNQTDFYFDTKFMRRSISPQVLRVDATVAAGMVASVQRSLITAYNGSSYTNVNATNGGNLKVSISEASDGLDIGAGNAGGETIRVSVASDDVNLSAIKTAVELIDNAISGNEMQVDLVGSVPAGTNVIGDVGISGARTSGGTTFHSSLGTSTLTQIKSSAGQLYWIHVINLKASVLYLQVFNLASASVTLGTTTPNLVFPIPTQGDTNGAGFMIAIPNGIAFSTGISWAITTTATGATTAGSAEAYLNAGYA